MSVFVSVPQDTQQSSLEVPSTYYYWSVFNIYCCCAIFGLNAKKHSVKVCQKRTPMINLLYSLCLNTVCIHLLMLGFQAVTCIREGDLLGAKTASESALNFNLKALICGLVIWTGLAYYFYHEFDSLIRKSGN